MTIARSLREAPFERNSVVSVGSFDGVHRAHQEVIQEVVRRARNRGGRGVIVTFDPHPKQVLAAHRGEIRLLTTLEERIRACTSLDVDLLLILAFTYEFSRQSFREFYERYIVNGVGVSEVIEGYDHHFGRDREGSVQELLHMGSEFDFSVTAMKPVTVDGEIVSSTAIRTHLASGNVSRAAELMGRPYMLPGTVVRGDGRGRSLGYPTANIQPSSPVKVLPANGVYLVNVRWDEVAYYGLLNIGTRPTFGTEGLRMAEVHLLGFDGDLYGTSLEVSFLRRLRDEKKFSSAAELAQQIQSDKQTGLVLIQEYEKILRAPQAGSARR